MNQVPPKTFQSTAAARETPITWLWIVRLQSNALRARCTSFGRPPSLPPTGRDVRLLFHTCRTDALAHWGGPISAVLWLYLSAHREPCDGSRGKTRLHPSRGTKTFSNLTVSYAFFFLFWENLNRLFVALHGSIASTKICSLLAPRGESLSNTFARIGELRSSAKDSYNSNGMGMYRWVRFHHTW